MNPSPGTRPADPATPEQRILGTLVADPVLTALGFDRRTVAAEPAPGRPGVRLRWSDEWSVAASGVLGTLDVDVTGVGDGTRTVVLDRVATALTGAHRPGAPLQVRRRGPARFDVLAVDGAAHRVTAGRR